MQYSLIVAESSMIPRQVENGFIIERTDLSTTQEEADIIIVQRTYQFLLDVGIKSISVICDDTDAFVLLAYFYQKLASHANVSMYVASGEHSIVDIDFTVKHSKETIPSI